MKSNYFRSAALVALAVAPTMIWGASAQAAAQPQATQPQAAPPTATLGEVIVTARKRQESIMNVPVVETAIPQEKLQRFQTQDLHDIARLVPGLSLGGSLLSIGTQVSIRGVGTTTFNPGIDQSVALNLDGLQLSQGLAYASGVFDMGQVEVLKGPQALFYGKSSPGGVISITTADPTDKFEVIGRVGHEFQASETQAQIIISGPVTDTLKMRLATQWDTQQGFYENVARGVPQYGGKDPRYQSQPEDSYFLRLTTLWNPTDQFSARLKINQARDNQQAAGAAQFALCPEGNAPLTLAPGLSIPFMSPNDTCKIDRQFAVVDYDPAAFGNRLPNGGTPYLETTQTYGTLELNYRPRKDLTLSSTTGYYLLHSSSLFNTSLSGAAAPILAVTNAFHRREVTEELRANSDFAGPLNFTAGAYLQRAQFSDEVTLYGNQALAFITRLPPVAQKGIQTIDIDTNSVFGQLRYKVIPQVEVAFGARYTDEKRTNTPYNLITGVHVPVALATPEIHSKTTSPELTITYKPTEDMTVFGALKRGYKSGSFDTATPPTPGEDNAFGDEKVEGGEVGLKSRWLDRRMLFNIAYYNYQYTGLQVGAIIPVEGGIPVTKTINAGGARVWGIESDVAFRPDAIPGLNLNASVNWNNARFTSLDNVPCFEGQTFALGCNENPSPAVNRGLGGYTSQNQSGIPLVRAPKWQANFGFDWEHDIGNDMTLVLSNNTQYSSRYLTGLGFNFYQPSFFKTDVSMTLRGPKDRWEFALIGKNLNDALTSGNCSHSDAGGGLIGTITGRGGGAFATGPSAGPSGLAEIGCWMDRGREVWLRLTVKN